MVIAVSPKIVNQRPAPSTLRWTAAAVAALLLGACSGDKKEVDAPVPRPGASAGTSSAPSGGYAYGGAVPGAAGGANRFKAPGPVASGTPDLNTVPTPAPKARSSREEREETIAGLVADRSNARYADQGGRTMPVAVRPLVDTPEAAKTDAVARLEAAAPQRPPAPVTPPPSLEPLPQIAPVNADVGPRSPGSAPRRGAATGGDEVKVAGSPVSLQGFRPLAEFSAQTYSKSSLAGTMSMIGGGLTPNDRNVLNSTARAQIDSRGKGVLRVVGHGTGGMDRAVVAANELLRLGVAKNNIYIGMDMIAGPTEVFLDRAK